MTPSKEKEFDTRQESHDQEVTISPSAEALTSSPSKAANGPTTGETEAKPVIEAQQPPNGGLEAWLRVLAGFFVFLITW